MLERERQREGDRREGEGREGESIVYSTLVLKPVLLYRK